MDKFILILGLILSCLNCCEKVNNTTEIVETNIYNSILDTINTSKYNASENIIILVDYNIPSNQDRLFIFDLKNKSLLYSCWCAHGFGGGSTNTSPKFSNEIGSNCSSLGLFLIDRWEGIGVTYGYPYHSVEGLSITNSNARKRQILIHPWHSVTKDNSSQIKTPMKCDYRSAGCFTVTDSGYKTIHNYIINEPKKILLYSFYNYENKIN